MEILETIKTGAIVLFWLGVIGAIFFGLFMVFILILGRVAG